MVRQLEDFVQTTYPFLTASSQDLDLVHPKDPQVYRVCEQSAVVRLTILMVNV